MAEKRFPSSQSNVLLKQHKLTKRKDISSILKNLQQLKRNKLEKHLAKNNLILNRNQISQVR